MGEILVVLVLSPIVIGLFSFKNKLLGVEANVSGISHNVGAHLAAIASTPTGLLKWQSTTATS